MSALTRTKPRGLVRRLLRLPIPLDERWLGGLLGHRFLLPTHRGRASGHLHQTVLEGLRYDPATRECIVVSAWGPRADWYRNLQAGPAVEVRTGRLRYAPTHRVLDRDEAAAVLARWERDPAARRRILDTAPVVAFRPRAGAGHPARDG
ncbi:MAG: nitroreductase family deazaflavin-dependent oxidoreductase [Sphaerobacter sp.]|nr:nitroreductase family deazaflavin-dependent oxidoreductase [Sphaerobacter sp.]